MQSSKQEMIAYSLPISFGRIQFQKNVRKYSLFLYHMEITIMDVNFNESLNSSNSMYIGVYLVKIQVQVPMSSKKPWIPATVSFLSQILNM